MRGTECVMDRVTADTLTLADVAKYWARAAKSVHTKEEIVSLLVQAIWSGDLTVEVPAGRVPRNGEYRYSLLDMVARVRTHPGLLFVRPGEPVDPAEQELADGYTLVDLRERVAWVEDGEAPDEATARVAFTALSSVDLDAYDPSTILPILWTLTIDREALRQYCKATGRRLPEFWFGQTAEVSTASAGTQCRKWLSELVQKGPKPAGKTKLKSDAQKLIPKLSGAAFDAAWDETVPPEWKEPGAPRKPIRRHNP
jgi:hypothetical protein